MTSSSVTPLIGCFWVAALAVGLAGCSGGDSGENGAKSDDVDRTGVGPVQPYVPDDPKLIARMNQGVAQMGRFEYSVAHDTFQNLVDEHPNWIDARINLAIATINRQGDDDEAQAMALLQDVLSVDPENVRAQYCIGVLKQYRGEGAAARTLFERVAAADPTDPYAAYFAGQSCETDDAEKALRWYQRAIEIDPYLRSAYYRAFQNLQRLGRQQEAMTFFEEFQQLEKNPRARMVEIKYTRMGPKATAQTVDLPHLKPLVQPAGPPFLPWSALLEDVDDLNWRESFEADPPSMTACDINQDGRIDLFLCNVLAEPGDARNLVLLQDMDGNFVADFRHVLAYVDYVCAALWGDFDNDGRTDVYLCRRGPNQLWRQTDAGEWQDVTASTGTANGAATTVHGALFDADHDGDLDIFCVNADAPNELLNNNLDGTFRPLAAQYHIAGDGRASRQVLPVDLDRDRDLDLVILNETPPHEVYLNDRLWSYHPVEHLDDFRSSDVIRVVATDRDVDGAVEIHGLRANGDVIQWARGDSARWTKSVVLTTGDETPSAGTELAVVDFTGDGQARFVTSNKDGIHLEQSGIVEWGELSSTARWAPVALDARSGPVLVAIAPGNAPQIALAGPGRFLFASLTFSGRVKDADSMRSNASGIGTHVSARIGSRWVARTELGRFSGPGQSLQPMMIGMGDALTIDFIAIDWSDGVFQSEMNLAANAAHVIEETQRQLSSCPVLFAWDGEHIAFVSDLLGVGGIGYMVAPHEYAPPRPWEKLLMPPGSLKPREGRYIIKLTEPMEEVCYLNSATLDVWDLPAGWDMVIDDRMNIAGPEPTGEPIFFHGEIQPTFASNDRGEDVLEAVSRRDLIAAPVGEIDRRFIGRLVKSHVLTIGFDRVLNRAGASPVLMIDGWVEYPYSQTMFSAWQAGADYLAPTLEARDGRGIWHLVHDQFGYPAGMPRRMALPLDDLPEGTTALRLSTNQEVYWDRIAIVHAEPCPDARRVTRSVSSARLSESGFPRRTTSEQRLPHYDYGRRDPFWDARYLAGWYTDLGDVSGQCAQEDDALVIFGPGEEVHIEFDADISPLQPGWSRRFVLDVRGWCKDMDLFTGNGETVEPLPIESPENTNMRYRSGR